MSFKLLLKDYLTQMQPRMTELSKIHNCEKCEGKIVCISIDNVGVTRCNYCNQVVDYSDYFRYMEAKRVIKEIENVTKDR